MQRQSCRRESEIGGTGNCHIGGSSLLAIHRIVGGSARASKESSMKDISRVFFLLVLFVGLAATAWPQTAWQKEWAKVEAAAEREGQVNIAGPPGDLYRVSLTDAFQKKYPKIRMEFNGASGRDHMPRLTRERQAGVFNWDIYIGGPSSALEALKPIGAFDPLRPELILPETFDDTKWHDGFSAGFMDAEEKLLYAYDGTVTDVLHVNWDFVSPKEFKSLKELLDPKWVGKIAWEDPRQEGAGLNAAFLLSLSYGDDFLKKLLRDQRIVFTRDRRQLTEWVVRGRYPIGIALPTDLLKEFQEKGVGKNVKPLDDSTFTESLIPGFGAVGVMSRRPHPNAAKVYLNWLLSKEGQTSWVTKTGTRNSRRLDVAAGNPDNAMKPNKKYIQAQTEKMIPKRESVMKITRELIPN